MNQKGISSIIIILIIVGVLVIGGGAYLWQKSKQPPSKEGCTTEAKICPDGTAVGRTGPNCEFAPCPQKNCIKEGETDPSAGINPESAKNLPTECCEGLKPIQYAGLFDENCGRRMITGAPSVACTKCGDGKCANGETKCNCPEDCGKFDISDWKTYQNKEYGFEISFPESWGDAKIERPPWFEHGEQYITFISSKVPSKDPLGSIIVSISIYNNKWNLGIKKLFETLNQPNGISWSDLDDTCFPQTIKDFEITSVAKEEALRKPLATCPPGAGMLDIIYFTHGNKIYRIDMLYDEASGPTTPSQWTSIFNQILSTFKFISQ